MRKNVLANLHEPLDLAVFLGNEFDNKEAGKAAEEAGNFGKGNIIGNAKVMDEGQGHNSIRGTSCHKGHALLIFPTDARAGIGEIRKKRKEVCFLISNTLKIAALNARRVTVKGDG